MKQHDDDVIHTDEFSEEAFNDDDGFGEEEPAGKAPLWKRELLFGYTLPWILGGVLLLAAGIWFVFTTSTSDGDGHPSDAAFSKVEHTLGATPTGTTSDDLSGSVPPRPVALPAPGTDALPADTVAMMKDIRDELDMRESRLNASITALQNSISQLSDAIKRDEAYAVETRNQLVAIQQRLATSESRSGASPASTVKASASKAASTSHVATMKVVSLEKGMAWIKWQGSTWAVREGDPLGKVTILRIDPDTRTVSTTGGVLR